MSLVASPGGMSAQRGRPRFPESDRRSEMLRVMVTLNEKALAQRLASASGKTMSDVLRELLLTAIEGGEQ
jgi:hypothetical protein